jgi:radical SAM protein with 4Fe4S-binding SPASM domain
MDICRRQFEEVEFVICTNLVEMPKEVEEVFDHEDVFISTSIDGDVSTMTANRTSDDQASSKMLKNFEYIVSKYGPDKIAALPTITEDNFNDPRPLIDMYRELGFQSIFLRPVNYMGFARKQHPSSLSHFQKWNDFYHQALEYICEINDDDYFEEFYASMCIRNAFGRQSSGYVDFKSPSNFLSSYCVIDFDGKIYPSDEARMLSRSKHVDLAMGTMSDGFDEEKRDSLNFRSIHHVNEDCTHCAYMPFCGNDPIDDLSRYGRVDVPKQDTWFCNRQIDLFDFTFGKISEEDPKWMRMFLKWIFRSKNPPAAYEIFQ